MESLANGHTAVSVGVADGTVVEVEPLLELVVVPPVPVDELDPQPTAVKDVAKTTAVIASLLVLLIASLWIPPPRSPREQSHIE
jgi:hypothetical protein